ncbi:MAG TPA: zf-HC2 domain-containing protein [Candidatus Acidoferrum sp.]|nr:zf-HC2 domain-containing protein [Candidatus Acidoferrum sp.]
MRCEFADSLLQGYFDGELTGASAAEFERHLQHCVDCPVELVDLDLLRGRLQVARLYEVAPASLRRKIYAELRPEAPKTVMAKPLVWQWLAAAAALVLLAVAGWQLNPFLRTDDYQAEVAEEIVEAHVHSLEPGHLTGIRSADVQAVNGWFSAKVSFAPPVHNYSKEGFELQGGRLDMVEGRTVAAVVYEHNGHRINVFAWPTRERDDAPHAGSRQGYEWIAWRKAKMEFCAVSDMPAAELQPLQRLITD